MRFWMRYTRWCHQMWQAGKSRKGMRGFNGNITKLNIEYLPASHAWLPEGYIRAFVAIGRAQKLRQEADYPLPPGGHFVVAGKSFFRIQGFVSGYGKLMFSLSLVLARCDCWPGSATKDGWWGYPWVCKGIETLSLLQKIGRTAQDSRPKWYRHKTKLIEFAKPSMNY